MKELDLASLRNEYKLKELLETEIAENPISQLSIWLNEAVLAKLYEPTAMTVCTVSMDKPSSRILLLKGIDDKGLTFFSNYKSEKGKEIDKNPNGSLNFFGLNWKDRSG